MADHDPNRFANSLGTKLAARSRHVCFFFGAGVGRACGLPDISQLQTRVLARLDIANRDVLGRLLESRNLEAALSRLRRIAGLVSEAENFGEFTRESATSLDSTICQAIVAELEVDSTLIEPMKNLAAWAMRAGYRHPVELFTVNYDLLAETAFESLGIPYFDGFIGTLGARFQMDLVEAEIGTPEAIPPFFVRLWKLHGSVNWGWENDRQIVRRGHPVTEGRAAAIYPSDEKYDESRRIPYVVLQDRLRRSLNQPETLVIISGYSFGDDHLNELILEAAARRERSEFVAFCYDGIPGLLAERAARTPNLQVVGQFEAIIGGSRAPWSNSADELAMVWENQTFLLCDFAKLASYLARSVRAEPAAGPGHDGS